MTMDIERTDILISGGGIAGLTAAIAFGNEGFSVLCVDPAPPVTEADTDGADTRTTAFLQPARALLEEVGLWPRLDPHAMPLQIMRIADEGGASRDFDAADISDRPFAWNLTNWLIRREALARIDEMPNVTLRTGFATTHILTREAEARITLSDGARIAARLLIAADGKGSPVRGMLGIGTRQVRYPQKALSFAVTHPVPHNNVSTEIHQSGGPFTLVPLPDQDGTPCSAIVWMEATEEADRMLALDDAAFAEEATARSKALFGPLTPVTRPTAWPMSSLIAQRFAAERTALIAEAAHAVPPIGAQGLNMSLADIVCLRDLARAAPDQLGSRAMLDRYDRKRRLEVGLRVAGVDLLNRASMASHPAVRQVRSIAMRALHDIPPIRRGLMRLGLGG
ncbi:FAD-dependent monooxygenase [Aestuariibius sp. 2305UL40-4]|uniref:FAD-dependent monooxygenase n=1 Tax=Aestuariibius violaceus TaxID=3234132 RepID=UPI00398E52B2